LNKLLLIIINLIFAVSLVQAEHNYDEQKIKRQVRNQFDRLVEAAKSLNHNNYMQFFNNDKFTSLNEDGTITQDLATFSSIIEQSFSGFKGYKSLNFIQVKISVIDEKNVVLVNEYEATVILNDGELYSVAGAGTQVWNLSNQQWKLVHVSSSSRKLSESD
jgi:hypothetical protein